VSYNPLQTYRTSASDNMSVSSLTTHPHIQGDSRGRVSILGSGSIGHFVLNYHEAFICTTHFPPTCYLSCVSSSAMLPSPRSTASQVSPSWLSSSAVGLVLDIQKHRRLQIIFTSYYKTSRFIFSLSVCSGFLKIKLSNVWRHIDWHTLLMFRRNLSPP
jgi:hypothetical protein